MTSAIKRHMRELVPVGARLRAAAWVTRQRWLPRGDDIAIGLVRDLQATNPKYFHKFVWANHLMAYARWYEEEAELFAPEQMQPSRIELFRDLADVLRHDLSRDPSSIGSVLEVGCSQGYLLRYLETLVFPHCETLVGIDIDGPAIDKGTRHLRSVGSRVALMPGDMEDLPELVGHRTFDVALAAGVLSYLNEADATSVVRRLLQRTNVCLTLAGLACVERPNGTLDRSIESPSHQGQWIHNFDAMIAAAGGRVVRSRWEGPRLYNFQTISFTFAVPAGHGV